MIPLPKILHWRRRCILATFTIAMASGLSNAAPPCCALPEAFPSTTAGNPEGDVRSLDVAVDGDAVHLLLGLRFADAPEQDGLYYQRFQEVTQMWTDPVRVDRDLPTPHLMSRGQDYRIAVKNGSLMTVWITSGSGFGGRGPLVAAYSMDDGRTWQSAGNPADTGSLGDHGFIALSANPAGGYHVAWLDKRAGTHKGLFSSRYDPHTGRWSPNRAIDPVTCECCWNVLTTDSNGKLYALYRDADPRDMALAVSTDAGNSWQRQGRVGAFNWDFPGCPHVGGALALEAADSEAAPQLHALVWTGKPGRAGIYYLRRSGADAPWTPPQKLAGNGANYPALAWHPAHGLTAAWAQPVEDGLHIYLTHSADRGHSWSAPGPADTAAGRHSHPRLVATPQAIHLFWTVHHEGTNHFRHQIIPSRKKSGGAQWAGAK